MQARFNKNKQESTTMSETASSSPSTYKDERSIKEMIYDEEARGIPPTYDAGRDLALQANKLHDEYSRQQKRAHELYAGASAVASDAIINDRYYSKSRSSDLYKVPEIGPRLERANRKAAELKVAHEALSDVAGSKLSFDEDLQKRAEEKR
jgi:hypothetical protein